MERKYWIFYQSRLATKKLTLGGANKLKLKLMKEKGWSEADIVIKPAHEETSNEQSN